jgi:MFS family permease
MDTTFSYLNQQKTDWKISLSQTSISNEDQEELKGHLDDVIYELSESGLPDDEIWLLAMKRIGTIDTIESEFSKINPNIGFRRNCMLLVYGALAFMFMQLVFILLPAYLLKVHAPQITTDGHIQSDWNILFYGLALTLLILFSLIAFKGHQLIFRIKSVLTHFSVGFAFLAIMIMLASAYLTIQLTDVHGVSFKTLSIFFYMGIMGMISYILCLVNRVELRTIQAFNKRINWKTSMLIGVFAGLSVTLGYTYHINYLPAIIGCPLFAVIGWMLSYSKKQLINLFTAQLYIMGLWLSGITGEFAAVFHIYYFIVLSFLIIGYLFGRSRLPMYRPMNS